MQEIGDGLKNRMINFYEIGLITELILR